MPKATWNDSFLDSLASQAADGIEELAENIKTDAKEHCPWREGILAGSHVVVREGLRVEVGAGGPAAPYAVVQHERTDLHHEIGEAKWLENAFNRHVPDIETYVRKHLKL